MHGKYMLTTLTEAVALACVTDSVNKYCYQDFVTSQHVLQESVVPILTSGTLDAAKIAQVQISIDTCLYQCLPLLMPASIDACLH